MNITLTSEKQNPRAWGPETVTELWEIKEMAERVFFENILLQRIEADVLQFFRNNNQFKEAEREQEEFQRLKEIIRAEATDEATFQFTSGDYIYTFKIERGRYCVH